MSKVYFMRIPKEIVEKSIWLAPLEVRVLWITLLAKKGPDHVVRMSLPLIARAANLGMEETERAMKVLMEPDPMSTNKKEDGRRVRELPEGGYFLINGEYWDELMLKEYNREAKAEERYHKKGKGPGSREQIAMKIEQQKEYGLREPPAPYTVTTGNTASDRSI